MSGATYRIEVAFEPSHDADSLPFVARVYRESDDEQVFSAWAGTADDGLGRSRAWIHALQAREIVGRYYTDDDGNLVEQHSVKV